MAVDERAVAIERVYRERYVGFRNALATVTGSYDSARDVVQEAFARALRERRSFRGEGSLEGWIFRIAFRTALETMLAAALRSLPPRRRLIVFLRYFADLSYAEIAAACGISEGTVAAALAQARAALLEALEPEEVTK